MHAGGKKASCQWHATRVYYPAGKATPKNPFLSVKSETMNPFDRIQGNPVSGLPGKKNEDREVVSVRTMLAFFRGQACALQTPYELDPEVMRVWVFRTRAAQTPV